MNRLEAQKRKRIRRDALNRIRAAEKKIEPDKPGDTTLHVMTNRNHYARRFAKKRVSDRLKTTFPNAVAAIPNSWKGSVQIKLEAGTHYLPEEKAE